MKSYAIPHFLKMHTPVIEQGQMVSSSYGVDMQSGVAVRCTVDRSHGSEVWAVAPLTDDESEALESYSGGSRIYVGARFEPVDARREAE